MAFKLILSAAVLLPGILMAQTTPQAPARERAPGKPTANYQALHKSALVIDTHADTTQFMLLPSFDIANAPAYVHLDLQKARAGGLDAEFLSIWVDATYKGPAATARALRLIDAVKQTTARRPEEMLLATSTAGILRAERQNKLAVLMGIEGGHAINADLGILRNFYNLGVRYMTLTWSNSNEWAQSSGDLADPKKDPGLTYFGREVVREMNRLGMMVDISHVSDRSFYNALVASRAPVIASHSSARALNQHPRNMDDDMLRALAHNGGVCMVNFFSSFIDEKFRQQYAATAKERAAFVNQREEKFKDSPDRAYLESHLAGQEFAKRIPRPPLSVLIDHIDHIAKVAGIDHVGLGSDFDGVSSLPEGIDSAADLPKITQALLERGYSPADVKKILGGNLMRVFREVEQMARQIQAEGTPMPILKREAHSR